MGAGILLALQVFHVTDSGGFDVGSLKVSTGGMAAVVVLNEVDLSTRWGIWNWSTLVEERTKEEVVPPESPVLFDEESVEVWDEEEQANGDNTKGDTENASNDLPCIPFVELEGWRTLPDDNHGENTSSKAKVQWDHQETPLERIGSFEDTIFGDQENDGSKTTRDSWSNKPRSKDLGDTLAFPAPNNTVGTKSSNTHSDNTSDDTVTRGLINLYDQATPERKINLRCRNWHTNRSSNGEPSGGSDQSTNHSQHQDSGLVCECVDLDDFVSDSIRNTTTNQDSTTEFHH